MENQDNYRKEEKKRQGFIVLSRSIIKSVVWTDATIFKFYLFLIFKANFEKMNVFWDNEVVTIERGQFITSIANITKEYNLNSKKSQCLSQKQVRGKIQALVRANKVAIKGANKYSLITVLNYDFWQGVGQTTGQASGDDTGKSAGKQRATIEQYNNLNNLKKEKFDKKEKNQRRYEIEEYLTEKQKISFIEKPEFWKYKLTSPIVADKLLASYYFFEGAQFENEGGLKSILSQDRIKYQKPLEIITKAEYSLVLSKMRALREAGKLDIRALASELEHPSAPKMDEINDIRGALAGKFGV